MPGTTVSTHEVLRLVYDADHQALRVLSLTSTSSSTTTTTTTTTSTSTTTTTT